MNYVGEFVCGRIELIIMLALDLHRSGEFRDKLVALILEAPELFKGRHL